VVGILPGESSTQYNSLIINGHVDVAEVGDDKEWNASPFATYIKDSYFYGRGVADMKGGIAASLLAIKLLKELGITLQGDLQFQSVIGEEVGEAGTLDCTEKGYTADYALSIQVIYIFKDRAASLQDGLRFKAKKPITMACAPKMIHAGGGVKGANAIEKMMKIIAGLLRPRKPLGCYEEL
jgi:formylaminopyrimidine deformylase